MPKLTPFPVPGVIALMVSPRRTTTSLAPAVTVMGEAEKATTPVGTLIFTDLVTLAPAKLPVSMTITSPAASTWVMAAFRVRQGVAMLEQLLASLPLTETKTRAAASTPREPPRTTTRAAGASRTKRACMNLLNLTCLRWR